MARLAASRKGTLAIISGAFGIFRRDIAVAIGGYDTTTVGEDMEMVLRMHRYMLEREIPYSVRYVPEPVCWTEAPESLKFLTNQRIRWQRGALECLSRHKSIIFNPKYGRLGMVTLPTFVLVDLISPVVEILGYLLMLIFVLLGWLDVRYFIALTALIFSFGVFVTTMSLLIEQDEIENFSNPLDLIKVLLTAFVENFGYRQLLLVIAIALAVLFFPKSNNLHSFNDLTGPTESSEKIYFNPTSYGTYSEGSSSRMAVLLTDENSNWLGLAHGLKTIGIPFLMTKDYERATSHDVVMVYPAVSGRLLSGDALKALSAHPLKGGTLIGTNVYGGGLNSLFGFEEINESKERAFISFNTGHDVTDDFLMTHNLIQEPIAIQAFLTRL